MYAGKGNKKGSHLPQFEDLLFDLQGFVVGELDNGWLCLEQGLIDVHLRVSVDAVVCDVEVLDDLGFGELVHNAAARLLILDQLARYL